MPDLDFTIVDADVLPFGAVPTLLFKLGVRNQTEAERVQAIMLQVQIRIEATHRGYDQRAEERLLDLFGAPQRWGETVKSLLWTHAVLNVPGFTGSAVVELPVTCTYDLDVAGSKYFHALDDGEVPLLFLFSGTIFYAPNEGEAPRIAPISWEKEASFRMPVRLWKEMMACYFPNSAWLRVRTDVFDRLYAYKSRQALPTWEEALDRLLERSEAGAER
ncbi:MAG: DUF6084 family protein [Chloroflexota bacterium]